jgi:predicted lipoprotein with Yx(FWY)xxD motif
MRHDGGAGVLKSRRGLRRGLLGVLLSAVALGVFASPAAAVIAPIAQTSAPVAAGGGFELKGKVFTYEDDTHYHFEYGTSTAYGTSVPVPEADIGTQSVVDVSQLVTGLAPGTTYHFRIVATNSGGTGMSPDRAFNTSEATPPPGGGETPGGGSGETPLPPKGSTVKLKVVKIKGKRILASTKGRTLYSLSAEKKGKFICTEASSCLSLWKPIMVPAGGRVTAPAGLKLGSVKRPEGGRQATFRGLPLYTFVEDTKKGEANGEGLKDVGTWHAVKVPKPKAKKRQPRH